MKTAISRHTQTDTKALILREAQTLLLTRSYGGLSFQELAERVGIRKASLYHHFASKEALGIALLEKSRTQFVRWSQAQQGQAAVQQLQAYVRMFRDAIGAGQRVCPLGATACGWDALEPALQSAVQQLHQTQLQWLSAVVAQWHVDMGGDTQPAATLAAQRALQINAMLQGALISARVQGDAQVFDMALAPLQQALVTPQGV